jgi:hypothetical protein
MWCGWRGEGRFNHGGHGRGKRFTTKGTKEHEGKRRRGKRKRKRREGIWKAGKEGRRNTGGTPVVRRGKKTAAGCRSYEKRRAKN